MLYFRQSYAVSVYIWGDEGLTVEGILRNIETHFGSPGCVGVNDLIVG
jgi:hypothetical protein